MQMINFSKLLRFTLASGSAAATVWLAILVSSGNAGANVFTLVSQQDSLSSHIDSYPHPGGSRIIRINDVEIEATLMVAEHDPAEAIRRLALGYSEKHLVEGTGDDPYAKLDAVMAVAAAGIRDGDLDNHEVMQMLGMQSEIEKHVDNVVAGLVAGLERPLLSINKDWAAFGRFPTSTWTNAETESGRQWQQHSYNGLGFLVIATPHQTKDTSMLWHLEFPKSFRMSQLTAKDGGDSRGTDIAKIARYPGTRRIGSIGEESAFGKFDIAGFTGKGSTTQHALHFTNVLQRAGYTSTPHQSEIDGSFWIVANNGKSEVSIYVTESADRQDIIDIVQLRTEI